MSEQTSENSERAAQWTSHQKSFPVPAPSVVEEPGQFPELGPARITSFILCRWQDAFPEGIAQSTYTLLSRMIRVRGTHQKITLNELSDKELYRVLLKLEKGKPC